MKLFDDWEWGDTMALAAFLAAVSLVSIGIFAICQDHRPQFFFVTNPQPGFCVTGYTNWGNNYTVFCSDDIHKSMDVMDRMNASLKRTK